MLTERGELHHRLARISRRLTAAARDRPAIASLRLLAVLDAGSSTRVLVKRRASRTDGPLAHFASPRGEKSGLKPFATRHRVMLPFNQI